MALPRQVLAEKFRYSGSFLEIVESRGGAPALEFVPKVAIGPEPWYSIRKGKPDGGYHGLDRGQSGKV